MRYHFISVFRNCAAANYSPSAHLFKRSFLFPSSLFFRLHPERKKGVRLRLFARFCFSSFIFCFSKPSLRLLLLVLPQEKTYTLACTFLQRSFFLDLPMFFGTPQPRQRFLFSFASFVIALHRLTATRPFSRSFDWLCKRLPPFNNTCGVFGFIIEYAPLRLHVHIVFKLRIRLRSFHLVP